MYRSAALLLITASFLATAGCASTASTSDENVKFHVSDRAEQLLEEQGKSLAAMRGYDRDSPLVCERFQKTGSHIKLNVCYTRQEMEERRLNHQENYRYMARGGTCLEPRDDLTGQVGGARTAGCGNQ